MLKVECESCKAPYQIDERRVPPSGLKMRCPKCGHSFLVTSPAGGAPAPTSAPPRATQVGLGQLAAEASKAPSVSSAGMRRTMVGVAPPSAAPAGPASPPPAMALPSDFPAALGGLDEADLPVVAADLPAARAKAAPLPPPPVRKPGGDLELDLPEVAADLPAPVAAGRPVVAAGLQVREDAGLPVVAAGLPARVDAGLPVVAAGLPARVDAGLPVVAAGLPAPTAGLPAPVAAGLPVPRPAGPPPPPPAAPAPPSPMAGDSFEFEGPSGFGDIDLAPSLDLPPAAPASPPVPPAARPHHHAPSLPAAPGFGEIDLPHEMASAGPPSAPSLGPPPSAKPVHNSADFGDLDLVEAAPSVPPPARTSLALGASIPPGRGDAGGMTFGEVDFGGESARTGEGFVGVDAAISPLRELPAEGAAPTPAATTRVSSRPPVAARLRTGAPHAKRSARKVVTSLLAVAALLGGAALQLTTYGAYGYLAIGDAIHAKDYAAALSSTMASAEKSLGSDTYDDAKSAIDAVVAARARLPRVKPLPAYGAVVDYATTVRFGADPERGSRAAQLLADATLTPEAKYLDVATAARSAEGAEWERARKALDDASRRYPGDPIQLDIALLQGNVELAAKDAAAAVTAFKRALALSADARAHFGLARAYDALGDAVSTKKEIDATLALVPLHPGALTLRARRKSAAVDEASARRDLATVLDGAARAKASKAELSRAFAARAWVSLERGAASEARDAFAEAVKIDPRNVEALNGQGRLLLSEGRYTEALSRFDTALQFDATSPETIANDAEAKLALERLAEAKQQLTEAKQRFPKSLPIYLLLGKVEAHLGNPDAAEQDLRAALSFTDPSRSDAVLPFVALSGLLSARGRLSDAKAVLDDARKRLPPSAALDRAVGEVDEEQGEYDAAIAMYRSALAKDPHDVASHFRLAVVLRRTRKFDEASSELDRVAAVDKDYPAMSLERGLLYEDSGDVEKAIEQFKVALARAPDDPDLQLRVGSAYVAIGRPDDALPMLRKVLEKRPTSAEAHHYIGRALMLRGAADAAEALRYLKRAVDLDPNRAEFHVYLAWAANDAQPAQLGLARDEIDRALALDKQNAEAYWQRGVLERMQGAVDDAIKDERHALELRPSRYEAHATLAECYEDKNVDGTAMGEWARAVAGDGKVARDVPVPHPFWRYRYGKLLLEHGRSGAALDLLLPAAKTAEADTGPRPAWLAPLEFLTAEALRKSGRKADAVEHYRRFLEIAPVNSPDRADAQRALKQLSPDR